jgi:MFS family permease
VTDAAPSTGAASGPSFPFRFTFPLLLGSTLNPINSSMLATGLAGIAADFRVGPGESAALISVLYLCSAVAQPTMGKLAQLFGPRRVFLVGIAILFAAGVIGAVAPAFWVLLVSRALIGIGTSAAYPTAMALVRRRADALGVGVPSRTLGWFSITAQVTVILGLPIGGVLTQAFGWRALFLVNVPLAIGVFLFALLGIEKDGEAATRGARQTVAALDLPGIGLFAATVLSLLVFFADIRHPVWWLLAVFAVALAGLILRERRAASPLIDVRMLAANRPLQRTYLRLVLVGLGMYTGLYGISQWLQDAAGYPAGIVGLIMVPLSLTGIVLARLNSSRGWVRVPLIVGAASLGVTGLAMLGLGSASPLVALLGLSVLFGIPNGLSSFANQATLYVQAPADQIAVAAGLQRTSAYLGAIFSSSIISLTFGARVSDAGFHVLAWVVIGIGIAGLLLTVLDRRIPLVARERAGART